MKAAAPLAILALAAACGGGSRPMPESHWAALPVLGALDVALLYHARSGTAPPSARLAHWYGEVCAAPDAAAREQAALAAGPMLDEAARRAAGTRRWVVPVNQTLAGYDLGRGGFATNLRRGTVVPFDRFAYCRQDLAYLVLFENGQDFALLPVAEDRARAFVRSSASRKVVHDLEVEVTGAQPGPPSPTLVVRIVRIRTRDAVTGRILAEHAG
jgi:hypothetical protein